MNDEETINPEIKFDHLYKIILVGDMGVGKSCLLSKYVKGIFPTSPLPTIAVEFATKIIQLKEGGYVKAQIWDTAGQEKYKSITSYHYRKAVGALLVYDISKKQTFVSVQKWLSDLRQFTEPDCVVMLVGNKLDIVEKNPKKREVSLEESRQFAEENRLLMCEASALTSYKVTQAFEDLLQEVYNEKRKVTNVTKQTQKYNNIVKIDTKRDFNTDKKCC